MTNRGAIMFWAKPPASFLTCWSRSLPGLKQSEHGDKRQQGAHTWLVVKPLSAGCLIVFLQGEQWHPAGRSVFKWFQLWPVWSLTDVHVAGAEMRCVQTQKTYDEMSAVRGGLPGLRPERHGDSSWYGILRITVETVSEQRGKWWRLPAATVYAASTSRWAERKYSWWHGGVRPLTSA